MKTRTTSSPSKSSAHKEHPAGGGLLFPTRSRLPAEKGPLSAAPSFACAVLPLDARSLMRERYRERGGQPSTLAA
jgi:hypothetical protein